ncbi:sensor histidine kinase [Vibrio sp. B1FLJ16]|uniref:sensor histidine kinase n=1 Tax=Vibrio sp. B1FLJ16 TaxID=2751178 RepID=UPI0015F51923|nr:sensor histidine kinase [Vibrio sp. B1FLJ16]CAD7800350.1 Histidine kinase [Vibrio sp. B1FLJ16]CAD7800370.1 Histidine kinase [Vibrio sp. B1FLJ16]CAE6887526.1 Histidine kinase [Vibrio sp. B1FLJ16]CAE6888423.1 Histidine kinase [Vibrio sp. B1FLJ16]
MDCANYEDPYKWIRFLNQKLQNSKEEERASISRELHDDLGQILTAIQINLQLHKKENCSNSCEVDNSIDLIEDVIERVRHKSAELRPGIISELCFIDAIKRLLEKMSSPLKNKIGFTSKGNFPDVSQQLKIDLFRIIQEAVNNAIRHANASTIFVNLEFNKDTITVDITDDGTGFEISTIQSKVNTNLHLGLLGMEERAMCHNGKFSVESQVNTGTRILAELKYDI